MAHGHSHGPDGSCGKDDELSLADNFSSNVIYLFLISMAFLIWTACTMPLGSGISSQSLKAFHESPCHAGRQEFLRTAAVLREEINSLANELRRLDPQAFDDIWHGPDGRSVFIVPQKSEGMYVSSLPTAVPEGETPLQFK